jgi:hypothetical protein
MMILEIRAAEIANDLSDAAILPQKVRQDLRRVTSWQLLYARDHQDAIQIRR